MNILKNLIQKKLVKETGWSFLTQGTSFILFILLNIILARFLGVDDYGFWSFFLSIMTLVLTLSYFGIDASSKRFIAQYNKTDYLKKIISSSIKLRFIFSFVFALFFFLIHKQLAIFLNNPDLEVLFLMAVPLIFFSGVVEFLKSVFIGLHRIKYNFFINLFEYGLKLILVILFFLFSTSVLNILQSYIIALIFTSLAGFYFLYTKFYKNLKTNNSTKDFIKEILNYSLPFIFISLGFIAATEIDTIMIGMFSTTKEVGIYAIAKQIILKLPHISLILSMGVMPIFAKLNSSNKEELKNKFYKLLKLNTIIFIFICFSLLILSPIFIPLIFGIEYSGAVFPLQILLLYLFLYATSIIFSGFLDYVGKAKKRAINIAVSILINIFLNLILIPQYGAVGAAMATSISYIPYVVLNWLEVKKSFD